MAEEQQWQSSCICGSNVISYTGAPLLRFKCHCTDERKLTGAAFALNQLMSDKNLRVVSGELATWAKKVDSGATMTNHSCGQCGSLLYRSSTAYPGTIVIKVGCIDGKDYAAEFVPQVEVFTRSRLPWVPAVEGAKQEVADFTA